MAREATITQEQVNAAADAIRATGAKPTARAVRDHLGTGSMATVLKLLQVWQAGQVKPPAQDVTLPPVLTRALADFVGQEVAQARAALEADLAAAQQTQMDLIAESERQSALIEGQRGELEQAHTERAGLAGKLALIEADLVAARDEAARERHASEMARTELAKVQLRLDALPRIEAEADRLRAELDAERRARVEAGQQAAVAAAKLDGAQKQLAQLAEQTAEARKQAAQEAHRAAERLTAAQAERDEARKAIAEARERAAGFAGQLEVLQREHDALLARMAGDDKPETPATQPRGRK